jgi:tetratricopeptide (TPR) repeat protein
MGGRALFLVFLGGLAVALGLAGGFVAWWHRTSQPDYRLGWGRDALRRGDEGAAERAVLLLRAAGAEDHAHLLQAEIAFARAKPFLDSDQAAEATPFLNRALDECNRIRDQGQLRLDAAALSGLCLLHLKEYAQAARALTFVVAERPDHADAHRGLAAIYYDQGALMRAVEQLQEVDRLEPDDGRPQRMIGHIYKDLDQNDRAIDAFREALTRRLSPAFADDARANLAECLVKRGRHREALEVLDQCGSEATAAPQLLALRGQCLLALGQTSEARSLAEAALARHPDSVELLRLRARLHRDAEEFRAEASDLEQALGLDRHDYTSRYQLAQVYERLGRSPDAAEQRRLCRQDQDALEEMTKLHDQAVQNPWDAAVRRRLAAVCRKLDRPDQARMWLQAAAACEAAPERPRP